MTTTPDDLNQRGANGLPGHLGIVVTNVAEREIRTTLQVKPEHMAPNGILHAGTVVAVADTSCGYGCMADKPDNAVGFTTIELKSNHLGTARDGHIDCANTGKDEAAGGSYLLGDSAIKRLVFDPLLPEPLVDTACRQRIRDTVRSYEAAGQRAWQSILTPDE